MKRSLKPKLIILFVLIFFLGVTDLVSALNQQHQISNELDDFNYPSESGFQIGKFVEGDVCEILGEFAYTERRTRTGFITNTSVSSHYYLVPLSETLSTGNVKYVVLELYTTESVRNAELLTEQTQNYLGTGTEPDVWNKFPIKGKISELDEEVAQPLYDWFTYYGMNDNRVNYEDKICPYIITELAPDSVGKDVINSIITMLMGLLGIWVILSNYFRARKGGAVQTDTDYTPVNDIPTQTDSFGNTSASGNVSSPADSDDFFKKLLNVKNSKMTKNK